MGDNEVKAIVRDIEIVALHALVLWNRGHVEWRIADLADRVLHGADVSALRELLDRLSARKWRVSSNRAFFAAARLEEALPVLTGQQDAVAAALREVA